MLIPTDSGATLDVEVHGDGEPLLLIAGMSAHRDMWGPELLDALTAHFAVAVYDHRGIGGSSRAEGGFTIADLAADAAACSTDSAGMPLTSWAPRWAA